MTVVQFPSYTYTKLGVFYYSRRVPRDLLHHYITGKVVMSLRTKSSIKALHVSQSITSKLNDYWLKLRLSEMDIPAGHLLVANAEGSNTGVLTISEARDLYVKLKSAGRSESFSAAAQRYCSYVIKCLGDRSLDQYTSADGGKFRDWLIKKGMTSSSVKRVFNTVRAMVNLAVQELGLNVQNAFSRVYLPDNSDSVKRKPISFNGRKAIQAECESIDDDMRWLVALISDTGMRLSEAAGLLKTDLVLDGDVPYVFIKPHSWRLLKTASSQRKVPLVGASYWAACRITEYTSSEFCFPRYASKTKLKSNSASAALNKWIKTIAGKDAVIHGFRHSVRDRLREVNAPTDLVDQVGGWALQSIGQGYGDGYKLEQLHEWLSKISDQRI